MIDDPNAPAIILPPPPPGPLAALKLSFRSLRDNALFCLTLWLLFMPLTGALLLLKALLANTLFSGVDMPPLLYLLFDILLLPIGIAVALSWHRALTHKDAKPKIVWPLLFDAAGWNYCRGLAIVIVGVIFALLGTKILMALAVFLVPYRFADQAAMILVGIACVAAIIYAMGRVCLFFPAAAVSKQATLFNSFDFGRHVSWRLLGAVALTGTLFAGPILLYIRYLQALSDNLMFYTLASIPLMVIIHIYMTIKIGILTHYYLWSKQQPQDGITPPPLLKDGLPPALRAEQDSYKP